VKRIFGTLGERTRALRFRLLADMAKLTRDATDDDIRRLDRRWWYVRKRLAVEATEPGESARLYKEMLATPELQRFFELRSAYRARHPELRRQLNRKYYERVLKDARSTPEARGRLAEARRRQREAKAARNSSR
jgi:hypothetical protein